MHINESRVKFDKTINLGHILTFAGFIMVALTQWNVMDKRVVVLEEARQAQRERDQSQDTSTKEKFQEVRDALTELKHGVEKVADKIGAK